MLAAANSSRSPLSSRSAWPTWRGGVWRDPGLFLVVPPVLRPNDPPEAAKLLAHYRSYAATNRYAESDASA
jgi:hypothetical protein